ncbi:MAG: hypothetical protein ACI8RZ_006864 [Myxococcota bacterium]|jgi:hypothetical protein
MISGVLELMSDMLNELRLNRLANERIADALEQAQPPALEPLPQTDLDVLHVSEMALILKCSPRTVRRRCESGQLPLLPGQPYRTTRHLLLRWIDDHARSTNAPISTQREMVRRLPILRSPGSPPPLSKSARFTHQVPPDCKASGK